MTGGMASLASFQRRFGIGTAEAMRLRDGIGEDAVALLARLDQACCNAAEWTQWKRDVAKLLERARAWS